MGKMKEIFMEIQESLGEDFIVDDSDELLEKYTKIKSMVDSSPTKSHARNMLETWRIFGNLDEDMYKFGKDLIKKEYE